MNTNLDISTETIGFTSVAKVAFIHSDGKSGDINNVLTEFKATNEAVNQLRASVLNSVAVCDLNGEEVVMTPEESRSTRSPEVGLKLIDYTDSREDDGIRRIGGQWVRDDGYLSAGGYKKAMEILGFDARKKEGKPLSEWLNLIEISESTHKKYTSGHAEISRVFAKLIHALLREARTPK